MNNEHAFLTYSIIKENDIHKGISLNPNGLNHEEIQVAIDGYKMTKDNLEREVLRLQSLVDNLVNELKYYKKWKEDIDEIHAN